MRSRRKMALLLVAALAFGGAVACEGEVDDDGVNVDVGENGGENGD